MITEKFEERALEAAMNKQNEQKQARTEQCLQKWTITPSQAKTTVKAKLQSSLKTYYVTTYQSKQCNPGMPNCYSALSGLVAFGHPGACFINILRAILFSEA